MRPKKMRHCIRTKVPERELEVRMKNKKHTSVVRLTSLALLAALVVVLQTIATGIKIGPVPISLTLVPIVVGAILFGPGAGAFLGGVFGVVCLIAGIAGTDKFTNLLWVASPFWLTLVCVGKAVLCGWVAGLVYKALLTPAGLTPKLILAEGRLMAAKAGVLVSRVLAVKRQQTPLVILDADCAQLLREIAFGASHRLIAPLAPESRAKQLVRVAGAISDLRDHFSGSFVLPELKLGECVAILDTGADGRSFGSNYGGSLGCAEFLIENGAVRCIRKRQTMDELMASFDVE